MVELGKEGEDRASGGAASSGDGAPPPKPQEPIDLDAEEDAEAALR